LDADVPEIKLTDSAEDAQVTLWPVKQTADPNGRFLFSFGVVERGPMVSQSYELVLQGDGYADADAAATAGREWRRYLTVALARERRGVDFGPDDSTTPNAEILYSDEPPSMFQPLGIETGDRVIADDYKLLVFPTEPTAKFLNFVAGTPRVSISSWLETFERRVRDVRQRDHQPWNRQKTSPIASCTWL
jgi:hypothetical protein